MQVFAENTIVQFTSILPHWIELAGDWEVALLQASWPDKAKNITGATFTLCCFDKKKQRDQQDRNNGITPDGYFPNVDILMS